MHAAALLPELGPRVTTSLLERRFYAGDLAYVPPAVLRRVADPLPDAVARPASVEEVVAVVRHAAAAGTPVVPRGGGSTAYGNAVPVRRGIVLDLNGLDAVGPVAADGATVWVGAGATWWELGRALGRRGLALGSYPSSARAATVGGWFAMGGLGIGSLAHGPLVDRVRAVEVVLPDGEIRRLDRETDPPLGWFAGSEGTLGVVTRVELAVRRKPAAESHLLVGAEEVGSLVSVAAAVAERLAGTVFHLHLNDGPYNRMLARLGAEGGAAGPTLAVDLEGEAGELARAEEVVGRVAAAEGGSLLAGERAWAEWRERFHALRVKRLHPALLGAELLLPLETLADYLARCGRLAAAHGLALASYGHVVARDRVLVMTLFPTDERAPLRYLLDASLLEKLYSLGLRAGGAPYAIGLWNTPYLERAFAPPALAERRARKRRLDPRGIMNPGKSYRAPWLLHPLWFGPGMGAARALRRLVGAREGSR
ncbi:MAG: hypothetical protein Kow0092_32010 [Deferrisomatales bacterium]